MNATLAKCANYKSISKARDKERLYRGYVFIAS